MRLSRTLAGWSSGLSFDDLPEAVVRWVKAAVLDFLSIGAAGSQAVGVEIRATITNIVSDIENLKNVGEVTAMVSKQGEYTS
jgi:2-methylcitrate dehydratase PrpD